MNRFARNPGFLTVLFCVVLFSSALLVPYAAFADPTFTGNVTVNSNLVVNGTTSTTNIIPSQANTTVYISGTDSDGDDDGGGAIIRGGAGWDHTGDGYASNNGGDVLIVGGASQTGGLGGNVILQGGSGSGTGGGVILKNAGSSSISGFVRLQTTDGTTRFSLQQNGTLNASGNYIASARILPQGDLLMGSFTNSP